MWQKSPRKCKQSHGDGENGGLSANGGYTGREDPQGSLPELESALENGETRLGARSFTVEYASSDSATGRTGGRTGL